MVWQSLLTRNYMVWPLRKSTMRWMAVFMRNLYKTGALKMEFLPWIARTTLSAGFWLPRMDGLFLSCVLIRYRDGVAFLRRLICIPILRNWLMTRTGVLCWFRCLLQPNQEKEVSLPKDMEEYRFGKVRNMICLFIWKEPLWLRRP